ncbi:MAG: zf-HC2 domain-containing protein, partial [Acidobacteriota bacterium]
MSGNGSQHPARSVEFLSRLHDGDLDPSERARFEGHRTHCSECRRAALEFEDAISLFRSSRSTPPRADLAARILRKVQSTNRPRAPFSPRFRLDLTWAALLVTALLALLISTPLAVRRSPPPVPVSIDRTVADRAPAASPAAPASEPEVVLRDQASATGRIASNAAPTLRKEPSLRKEERQEVA